MEAIRELARAGANFDAAVPLSHAAHDGGGVSKSAFAYAVEHGFQKEELLMLLSHNTGRSLDADSSHNTGPGLDADSSRSDSGRRSETLAGAQDNQAIDLKPAEPERDPKPAEPERGAGYGSGDGNGEEGETISTDVDRHVQAKETITESAGGGGSKGGEDGKDGNMLIVTLIAVCIVTLWFAKK